MKVKNVINSRGNKVVNQFIITGKETYYVNGKQWERPVEVFQSYKSTIAKKYYGCDKLFVELDKTYWDYSTTTGKYRNQFLGETKKETEKKIKSGEYVLVDLN